MWDDNDKEWTTVDLASSTTMNENKTRWKGIVAKSSMVIQKICLWLSISKTEKDIYKCTAM